MTMQRSLALCGGPQDGTYNINPKHIRVKKPRNISDEELMTMSADFSHPLTEVTPLTYYLHRVRLGEVCREVADLIWELAGSDVAAISYTDTVLPLDQKFEDLLNDLPMHSSGDDLGQVTSCASRRIITQRHFTNLTVQARRCKLHLPFLLRVSRNERYEFSRRVCLRAARTMLRFRDCIPSFKIESVATKRVRIVGVLHHFFCAIMVLVMDLCMNRSAEPENERKAEIQSACDILEEARQYSGSAGVLLEALMDILQKHKVRIQMQTPDSARIESVRDRSVCEPLFDANIHSGANGAHDPFASGDDLDFGELWQSYVDMGSDITARQWDTIFADLDGSASYEKLLNARLVRPIDTARYESWRADTSRPFTSSVPVDCGNLPRDRLSDLPQ
nr:putative transcription factor lepb [Quercus suber]